MAIAVKEVKGSRRGGWNAQGGRTYSLNVQVITDDPTIGVRAALRSVGVDAGAYYKSPLASPNEWDYGAWLNNIEAAEASTDGKQWLVTLSYGTLNWQELNGGAQGDSASTFTANPMQAPPTVRWSSETEEVVVNLDRNGVPVLNTAGDPLQGGLTRPKSTPICTITRMLPAFDPNWLLDYKDHVNKSEWQGFPAGAVLCKDMTADRVYLNDYGYSWEQTITLAFRSIIVAESPNPDAPWETDTDVIEPGWAVQVLNAGLRQRVPDPAHSGQFLVKQILIDGSPTSSEVYLTKDGTFDPNGDPNYLTFDIYDEVEFSGFDLPDDLFSKTAASSPVGGS
jgi:hypothetical protein